MAKHNRTAITNEALKRLGGVSGAADRFRVSQPAVSQWRRIPERYLEEVATETGIAKEMLRPDLFPQNEEANANG